MIDSGAGGQEDVDDLNATAARYSAVTTCNAALWQQYGRAMATTFDRHWAPEVSLTVYAEGFAGEQNGRVNFVDLDQAAPWLAPWKAQRTKEQRGYRTGKYHFRDDAVRFSHKIAAIGAAVETPCDVLAWLDADVISHSQVTIEWLDELCPPDADVAWLDRQNCYAECGVLFFRFPRAKRVIGDVVNAYQTGEIFKLQEWHDSYIWQTIITAAEKTGQIKVASLSGNARKYHHVCASSPLSQCLDHLKGRRKVVGRTSKAERHIQDDNKYWI